MVQFSVKVFNFFSEFWDSSLFAEKFETVFGVGFVCFLILNGRGTGPLTGEEKLFTRVLGL